jgi:hypothetical protein
VKNGLNCIWRILADFLIRSGGLEKNHLATLASCVKEKELNQHLVRDAINWSSSILIGAIWGMQKQKSYLVRFSVRFLSEANACFTFLSLWYFNFDFISELIQCFRSNLSHFVPRPRGTRAKMAQNGVGTENGAKKKVNWVSRAAFKFVALRY